eukprot:COSAG05_NODE_7501_length_804_cov_1.008511_1_plen_205_part_10
MAQKRLYKEVDDELPVQDWEKESLAAHPDGWAAVRCTKAQSGRAKAMRTQLARKRDPEDEEAELEALVHRRSLLPVPALRTVWNVHSGNVLAAKLTMSDTNSSAAVMGALDIRFDEEGVGELVEMATLKLLQSRQLDHAFVQFGLASQLHCWLTRTTQSPGPLLWNQACCLCTAVSVQLRRSRVVTPAELLGRHVNDVDGGLVAP